MEKHFVSWLPIFQELIRGKKGFLKCPEHHYERLLYHSYRNHPHSILFQLRHSPFFFKDRPFGFLPPPIDVLFEAFAVSEYIVSRDYYPFKSHEERLTGHLVSELRNGLYIVSETFNRITQNLFGELVPLQFRYYDLSAQSQEKVTGADLGIIFYINWPYLEEPFCKLAIFQAKKVDERAATIEVNQLNDINRFAGDAGFYLFYDMSIDCYPPLVDEASDLERELRNIEENKPLKDVKSRKEFSYSRKNFIGSPPLSIFLLELLLEKGTGAEMRSLREAGRKLRLDGENPVSHALIVSIGTTEREDLKNLRDLRI